MALGGVEVTGAPSNALRVAIVAAVRTGLGAGNPGPDAAAVPTCVTASCLHEAAVGAQADRTVAVTVAVTGEFHDQFAITVVVADADGRALRRRSRPCPTCAVDEATEHITALVAEAVGAVTDDSVAIEIATTPRSVAIVVDGVDRGRAPWSGSLPAGPHLVVAGAVAQDFFAEATGEPLRVEVAVPIASGHGRRFGLITYGTAAVGVGALAFGLAMIGKDGNPTCDHPSCPEVYDTATLGWVSVGVGVAALGAAGYMFWSDRRAEQPVIAVVPTSGGVAAFASGRF